MRGRTSPVGAVRRRGVSSTMGRHHGNPESVTLPLQAGLLASLVLTCCSGTIGGCS